MSFGGTVGAGILLLGNIYVLNAVSVVQASTCRVGVASDLNHITWNRTNPLNHRILRIQPRQLVLWVRDLVLIEDLRLLVLIQNTMRHGHPMRRYVELKLPDMEEQHAILGVRLDDAQDVLGRRGHGDDDHARRVIVVLRKVHDVVNISGKDLILLTKAHQYRSDGVRRDTLHLLVALNDQAFRGRVELAASEHRAKRIQCCLLHCAYRSLTDKSIRFFRLLEQ